MLLKFCLLLIIKNFINIKRYLALSIKKNLIMINIQKNISILIKNTLNQKYLKMNIILLLIY